MSSRHLSSDAALRQDATPVRQNEARNFDVPDGEGVGGIAVGDPRTGHGARMNAALVELWDAGRCARFLGYSYDYFRKEVRYWEGVPQPLEKPGRQRWLSTDWITWAENSRNSSAKAA